MDVVAGEGPDRILFGFVDRRPHQPGAEAGGVGHDEAALLFDDLDVLGIVELAAHDHQPRPVVAGALRLDQLVQQLLSSSL